jgi:hypothetical protein
MWHRTARTNTHLTVSTDVQAADTATHVHRVTRCQITTSN